MLSAWLYTPHMMQLFPLLLPILLFAAAPAGADNTCTLPNACMGWHAPQPCCPDTAPNCANGSGCCSDGEPCYGPAGQGGSYAVCCSPEQCASSGQCCAAGSAPIPGTTDDDEPGHEQRVDCCPATGTGQSAVFCSGLGPSACIRQAVSDNPKINGGVCDCTASGKVGVDCTVPTPATLTTGPVGDGYSCFEYAVSGVSASVYKWLYPTGATSSVLFKGGCDTAVTPFNNGTALVPGVTPPVKATTYLGCGGVCGTGTCTGLPPEAPVGPGCSCPSGQWGPSCTSSLPGVLSRVMKGANGEFACVQLTAEGPSAAFYGLLNSSPIPGSAGKAFWWQDNVFAASCRSQQFLYRKGAPVEWPVTPPANVTVYVKN